MLCTFFVHEAPGLAARPLSNVLASPLFAQQGAPALFCFVFFLVSKLPVTPTSPPRLQAAGGGRHRGRRGAEAEDRAAAEGQTSSAAGQQHDAPAALLPVGGAHAFPPVV